MDRFIEQSLYNRRLQFIWQKIRTRIWLPIVAILILWCLNRLSGIIWYRITLNFIERINPNTDNDQIVDYIRLSIILICEIIRVIVRAIKRISVPKNIKNKIWIVIAIYDWWETTWFDIKTDFVDSVKKHLNHSLMNTILLPNHKCEDINLKKIEKINKITKWHYWIFWKVQKAKDWKTKCFIETNGAIFHAEVDHTVKTELAQDFSNIYPKGIEFEDERYKSWMNFSWEYTSIIAKYIIGVAALISNDPFTARDIHKNLYEEMLQIEKKDNVEAKFNKEYYKIIQEKIKFIQNLELGFICSFFYHQDRAEERKTYLQERNKLCTKYNIQDWLLMNNLGIYEFLVNKNIPKAKEYIQKWAMLWVKVYRYSMVFLNIRNKEYKQAKKQMIKIFKKNDSFNTRDVIKFTNNILSEYPERFEYIYRQALLYYRKEDNAPEAYSRLKDYLYKRGNKALDFEFIIAEKLLIILEKEMKLKQF